MEAVEEFVDDFVRIEADFSRVGPNEGSTENAARQFGKIVAGCDNGSIGDVAANRRV